MKIINSLNGENKKELENISNIIRNNKNIFIASHINPDGDNIGSVLGLYLALKSIGKNAYPLISDYLPEDFSFLTGYDDFIEYDYNLADIDLLIILDSSDKNRLGDNKKLLDKAKYTINIDHHASNDYFADFNIVDSQAAATAEIVYYLLQELDIDITPEIGECLYTGINTDTGKFSYSNVSSDTHRIVAELLDRGTDFNKVNVNLYENVDPLKFKLDLEALKGAKLLDKVAYLQIRQKMLDESGLGMEDTNGLVEKLRKLKGVEVAFILKEIKKNEIKVSMRSKEYCNVAKICSKFNGGGHIRAAGCTIYESINKAEELILKEIKKYI